MRLDILAELYTASGPYASCYIDGTHGDASTTHEVAVRWNSLRGSLAKQGAPGQLLDALQAALADPAPVHGTHGRFLSAAGDRVLFDDTTPNPPVAANATWGPVPCVLPYLREHAWTVPYVVVVVDRVGGDLYAYGQQGEQVRSTSVDGSTLHLTKVPDGDWAQKEYQRRAENQWSRNAHDVAREADNLVAEVSAQTLVLAGDVRAREAVSGELSTVSRRLLTQLDAGGRAAGASRASLEDAVRRTVEAEARRSSSARVEVFAEQRGKGRAAAEGLQDVVAAARRAQISTLLLATGFDDRADAWIGPEPLQLGVSRDDLEAVGSAVAMRAPVGEALVRAAVHSGADLVFVDGDTPSLRDGVGALLRYAD